MNADFHAFVAAMLAAKLEKVGQAAAFVWWAEHHDGKPALLMDEICKYFARARLPQPNRHRLENELRRSIFVTRNKDDQYQLTRNGIHEGETLFPEFVPQHTVGGVTSEIQMSHCPYINDSDVADAKKMADLYVSLFCLENSMRRHIENVLTKSLGQNWWEAAAGASMKKKEQDRSFNEAQNKWIPSRSNSGPLYSVDWSDLVTLIRKHEGAFKDSIPDINFLHRFADLGNLRNVIAHNGVIDDPIQFKRIELAIHDWSKQIGG